MREHPNVPRILVATDGSEPAVEAARLAGQLFGPDVDYIVLYVAPAIPRIVVDDGRGGLERIPTAEVDREYVLGIERAANTAVAATIEVIDGPCQARVEEGDPADVICEVAEEGFSAIVVGSRGHGTLRRAVLGSVARTLLDHAPCAVFVTRPRPSGRTRDRARHPHRPAR